MVIPIGKGTSELDHESNRLQRAEGRGDRQQARTEEKSTIRT